MIKVGDKLPAGKLQEFIEVEGNGCSIGPEYVRRGKGIRRQEDRDLRVACAFTPTCSRSMFRAMSSMPTRSRQPGSTRSGACR